MESRPWIGVPYDQEARTVWVVRLVAHFTGCLMIYAGPARHPFLISNRRWLTIAFLFSLFVAGVEEGRVLYSSDALNMVSSVSYKAAETCISFVVLSGCFLIHAVLQRQDYRLTGTFYLVLCLYASALLTTTAFNYLANAVVSAVSLTVMRDFERAHEGGGGEGAHATTVQSIMRLEAVLVALNATTFCLSFPYKTLFGMKAAIYVLYIYRITLVYLLVRPYLAEGAPLPGQAAVL